MHNCCMLLSIDVEQTVIITYIAMVALSYLETIHIQNKRPPKARVDGAQSVLTVSFISIQPFGGWIL